MSKSIHFFGQSVFGQLISLIDRVKVGQAVRSTGADKFCKGFFTWDHLVSMLFCTVGQCTSLREVAGGCLGLKGKTEHLGLRKLPKRSTLSDANRLRTPQVFEKIYYSLLSQYQCFLSDSRFKKQIGKEVFLIDSTTISLFKAILKSAGRKPKTGKEKGGIKVHTLLKADERIPRLLWYSDASSNDINFWSRIDFQKDSIYVFDKGYIDYSRYEQLTKNDVYFVTRLQENATYESVKENDITDNTDSGVIKDEYIELPIRKNGKITRTVQMRRIAYWDQRGNRVFNFLTNLLDIDGGQIALLYKQRWEIETLFKQLKQNFPLKYFLGDNVNSIVIQIWCVLITNLLLTVINCRLKRKWAFSNIISFVRLHLFNYINLVRFLENPEKDWQKELFNSKLYLFSG